MTGERALRAYAEVMLGRQRSPVHEDGPFMVRYLRAANVKDGYLDLDSVYEMNFTPDEQRTFRLSPGDVLVTEGSGSLSSVGASAVWSGELPGTVCFQNTLLRLRPRPGTDPRFLAWWCRYAFADGLFASVASGANIFHLSAERVRDLPMVPVEPARQRAIADFLDAETARIDQIVSRRRRLGDLLEQANAARLAAEWDAARRRFGTVPLRRWLEDMEQGWSPQCEDRLADAEELGVLKAGCVNGGRFDWREHKVLLASTEPRLRYLVRPGDLLVSRASGSLDLIGSAAVLPHGTPPNLILCDKLYRLHLCSDADPLYIATMLRSAPIRELIRIGVSGGEGLANNLPSAVIKNLPIPALPREEQASLAHALTGVRRRTHTTREALDKQIALLQEHRQALISGAVSGELDIPGAA